MKHCKDCAHSKFDPVWGEYKCLNYKITVQNPSDAEECVAFKPREDKPGK